MISCALLAAMTLASAMDVVVVGAGMAGIGAAKKLQDNGHNVTLLEGRSRVGGRVWTTEVLGFPVDLGASWIHGASSSNPLTSFVTEFNLRTKEDPDEQNCRYDKDGYQYSDRELAQFDNWCWGSNGAASTGTLEASLRSYDPAFYNTVEGEMCLAGRDFNQGSAVDLVSVANEAKSEITETGGAELLFLDGYSTIPDKLVEQFLADGGTLRTGIAVTHVKYCMEASSCQASVSGIVNETGATMQYDADAVIVAVPLGVLQAKKITFSPELPTSYTAAISRMQFGVVNKAAAVFASDFWSADCGNELMLAINQVGASIDSRGMFPYFMNTNRVWPGKNALLGFATGRYAIAAEQKSDAEVQADFMARLRQQYPSAPDPIAFIRTKWGSDPFAHGSYTTPSGINAQGNELRILARAVSVSLTLAGEHTHPIWAATVHGAYQSGLRAADDVITGVPTSASLWALASLRAGVVSLALSLSL
mmetsp:Transcript_53178/g.99724  ORF Transcript_53178/g.99724 Transcript_53178/m.99724 type:complete len:478 (+) Transcript_53178:70-1503(+)